MAEKSNTSENVKIALLIFGGYLLYRVYKNFAGKDASTTGAPEAINCTNLWNSGTLSRDKAAYYNDADEIEVAVNGTTIFQNWWEDDTKIAAVLMRAGKDADVAALICAFGNRKPTALSPAQPLGAWISAYLDTDKVAEVNNYYQYKGISYRW